MDPAITNLQVKNFKSLRDSGNLELKPITLLVGANSSGKTTLLQTLLVLKQTLESRGLTAPLVLKGRYVNLGSFKDIVFRHDTKRNLEISLGLRMPLGALSDRTDKKQSANEREGKVTLIFRIGYDDKKEVLTHQGVDLISGASRLSYENKVITVSHGGQKCRFYAKEKENEPFASKNFLLIPDTNMFVEVRDLLRRRVEIEQDLEVIKKTRENLETEIDRARLYSRDKVSKRDRDALDRRQEALETVARDLNEQLGMFKETMMERTGTLRALRLCGGGEPSLDQALALSNLLRRLDEVNSRLQDVLLEDLYYIGPLREYPQRYYVSSGELPRDVGLRGEYTTDVIYSDSKSRNELHARLQYWLKQTELATNLKLGSIGEGLYALRVSDSNLKIDVNLADIGFGASQLLPIIVQGIYAPKGSVLLIEQPEIHLHPRIQALLGDFFIDMSRRGKQAIIETHSEHMILRLQRRIAEMKFSSNDLAIYSFEPSKKGTEISKVEMTSEGTIDRWPKGFFEEDIDESYELLKALGRRKSDESSD